MAKILALDTSTDACSVALSIDGVIQEDFRVIPRQHTRQLLPMVDLMLSSAGLQVKQLDAIAFGRGPGSFAGIRIATGTAQGLAFAADLPLLPVSTLAAIALKASREHNAERIVSTLDARMNELYCCAYEMRDGLPQALDKEIVSSPENIVLPEGDNWFAAGRGWIYLDSMSAAVQQAVCAPELDIYPAAGMMCELAVAAFARGEGVSAEQAQPVYLRDEVSWKKVADQKKKGQ
ncbi:tRNA (adenosine(37)-N6)-threonylcarbamoyltransferase complex dimerization subunit type 1 TsaB [Amphritea pacifica]|uniref:tRNA threonylcarbamoyladenosine biosynthesis protein TsaB n=1 Tax=Amphritea pacifica TaxID=2811233 RepID=A0ABS2WDH9_9GAMM|nr:tRNA (adenosine(37)-N6)-threonylcarbamoyltransferase complex dimerization subunit type 1 TsaB [Amphritea pacifica]MBN0989763.1 tRNA (adenosine(37)-N6)-threonylcarbamoyltransferase complex dimerization subunit type 1 TsaB [Amphritea pacifica]MBN1006243.1 tRNA (adenosine(37)-N6)-threonylcarbamoyltransferase complex dimerization subunit type 1 TsaB [Amphritea pacifica]